MTSPKVLVVEDDPEIREFLSIYLNSHELQVATAATGRQALLEFEQEPPDLVLLDVILPEMHGFDVCRALRSQSTVPIIFLSCKWETADIVTGLELGGNDYVTKPFTPEELLARIRANLRDHSSGEELLTFGPLQINATTYQVSRNGQPVSLSAKELQLLLFLARHRNRVFSVDELFSKVWTDASDSDVRTVMVHISNLRRKIEDNPANPRWIHTVRGFGYMFIAK